MSCNSCNKHVFRPQLLFSVKVLIGVDFVTKPTLLVIQYHVTHCKANILFGKVAEMSPSAAGSVQIRSYLLFVAKAGCRRRAGLSQFEPIVRDRAVVRQFTCEKFKNFEEKTT